MKADLQLKHFLFGRVGSMWERQTTAETKRRVRAIMSVAGGASSLARLDMTAAAAVGTPRVLVSDEYFNFADGDFSVIGRLQREYNHHSLLLPDGTSLHVGYRPASGTVGASPLPTLIANITTDFVNRTIADTSRYSSGRDWYLLPTAPGMVPVAIVGREEGDVLVSGADFEALDGYIAMTDDPAKVLRPGPVRAIAAYVTPPRSNDFVMSVPSGTHAARYVYKSQSLTAFRAAAAECAGFVVTPRADVVLSATFVGGDEWSYNLADMGHISVNYPHTPLSPGAYLPPGFVVCDRFEVVETVGAARKLLENWPGVVSLDGILPVKGLHWTPGEPVLLSSEADDPTSGKRQLHPHFGGDAAALARLWELQRLHELRTEVFLADQFAEEGDTFMVDFWDLLEAYYGGRIILAMASPHRDDIDARLRRFLYDYAPASCVMLTSLRTVAPPGGLLLDDFGNALLDEYGRYVPAVAGVYGMEHDGLLFAYDDSLLVY